MGGLDHYTCVGTPGLPIDRRGQRFRNWASLDGNRSRAGFAFIAVRLIVGVESKSCCGRFSTESGTECRPLSSLPSSDELAEA